LFYQQQVGALIYLAIKTRPDIAFAVENCARYMSKPDKYHFAALDRIWKYLLRYLDLGLSYSLNILGAVDLIGYYDSD